MDNLIELVWNKLEETERTGEMERQLDIIIEKEKKFTKEFSKDKFGEYLGLSFETLAYEGMKIEQAIKVTIEVLKDIQKLVAV